MPHRDVAISRMRSAHGCQRFTSRCDAVPVEGDPRICLIAHHGIAGDDPDAYDIADAIIAFGVRLSPAPKRSMGDGRNPLDRDRAGPDRGIRFARDSPLEGAGFEPSVPQKMSYPFETALGRGRRDRRKASRLFTANGPSGSTMQGIVRTPGWRERDPRSLLLQEKVCETDVTKQRGPLPKLIARRALRCRLLLAWRISG
jgi:hypothetical protein